MQSRPFRYQRIRPHEGTTVSIRENGFVYYKEPEWTFEVVFRFGNPEIADTINLN